MELLKNKVAFITGAGSGIGRAIALLYAKQGAKVIVSDINDEHGNAVVAEITADGGEAFYIKANTAKAEDVANLVQETVKKYGQLDIAVNNAGIGGKPGLTAEIAVDDWKNLIDINLSGVFYGCKYAIEQMLKNGGGSIINIGSIHSITGVQGSVAYAAAKHGVLGITRTAGSEYASQNIRINAVGPGYIETPLLNVLDPETKKALVAKHPIGRLGKSEEVAQLALFLASENASFMNAAYYAIDGGYTAL